MSEKQCIKCGATKPLAKFYADKRRSDGRKSRCKACESIDDHARYEKNAPALMARYRDDPEFRQREHDKQQRMLARGRENATNRYKEWTGPELELLLRDDLTGPQKAAMLKRTYSAVLHAMWSVRNDPQKQILAGVDRAEF